VKLDTTHLGGALSGVPEAARRAEATGYSAFWTAETGRTPFLPLVLAAEHTERITLGTAIAAAFARSPFVVAQYAWELQELSKGRFVLGLGTQVKGHNERRFSVPFEHPGPRLAEMIGAMRAIWAAFRGEQPLAFRGRFFRHDLLTPFFSPGPISYPDPPVYVAAVGEWMYRMAGEVADGVHVHPFHSVRYLEERALPALDRGLVRSGRSRSNVNLVAPLFVVATDDAETERTMAALSRQQIAFYGSTRSYREVFAVHGWGETQRTLSELVSHGEWGRLGEVITDEMLETYAVIGNWQDIPALVGDKYKGILDRAMLYAGFHPEEAETERELVRAFGDS
jgi:probable F420-dependent oxidoreductase